MSEHMAGKTVSNGTYAIGCRCDGCIQAFAAFVSDFDDYQRKRKNIASREVPASTRRLRYGLAQASRLLREIQAEIGNAEALLAEQGERESPSEAITGIDFVTSMLVSALNSAYKLPDAMRHE